MIDTVEANKVQHQFDNGKPGFSVGDVLTISADLDAPDSGTKLGHSHETCTVIHAKHPSLKCSAVVASRDGQLSVAGEFPPIDADSAYGVAGWTGAFENVGRPHDDRARPAPLVVSDVLSCAVVGSEQQGRLRTVALAQYV